MNIPFGQAVVDDDSIAYQLVVLRRIFRLNDAKYYKCVE